MTARRPATTGILAVAPSARTAAPNSTHIQSTVDVTWASGHDPGTEARVNVLLSTGWGVALDGAPVDGELPISTEDIEAERSEGAR